MDDGSKERPRSDFYTKIYALQYVVQWKWVSIKVNNNTNDVSSNNGKAFEEFFTTFPKRTDMAFMGGKKKGTH